MTHQSGNKKRTHAAFPPGLVAEPEPVLGQGGTRSEPARVSIDKQAERTTS